MTTKTTARIRDRYARRLGTALRRHDVPAARRAGFVLGFVAGSADHGRGIRAALQIARAVR